MSNETFICAMCGGEFFRGWSEEEAKQEAETNGFDIEGCDLVCDDCYKKTPWGAEEATAPQP